MVNRSPDQPDPTPDRPSAPDSGQTLGSDELLAVMLAFLGIGSILWWGLSRSPRLLAEPALLPRRVAEAPVRVPLAPADQPRQFVPRTLDPRVLPQPGLIVPPDPRTTVPRATTPRAIAPVPVAPAVPPREGAIVIQPLNISDLPGDHWAYPFIQPMFDGGYLPDFLEQGFQPDQPLTRAELAALLSQAFGNVPREGTVRSFSDVPSNYWAAEAIDNVVSQGFMNGYPEGDFRPDSLVPRYEVLVSLATGLNLAPPSAPDQTLQAFVDLDPMPSWARPSVAAAAVNNLIVNYPNRDQIRPLQSATRAEVVAMIHQALVQRGELSPVESEYAVPLGGN